MRNNEIPSKYFISVLLLVLFAVSMAYSNVQVSSPTPAAAAQNPICKGKTKTFTCGQTVTESCTLKGNIASKRGTCFTVNSRGITINCAGYSISGNNRAGTYGIKITGRGGNTIQNCRITGFESGIYLSSTSRNKIINTRSYGNSVQGPSTLGNGFQLYAASGNTFITSTADSNYQFGFLLSSSPDNTFINSTSTSAPDSASIGFSMDSQSGNNLFTSVVNEINYNGLNQKFSSAAPQSPLSSHNTGWWSLPGSDGHDATSQSSTAWYNGTSGGRNADGTYNPDLQYWSPTDANASTSTAVNITNCTMINTSGEYAVEADLTGTSVFLGTTYLGSDTYACLYVADTAENVTIDCKGHTLTENASHNGVAIYVYSSGVSIKNCIIKNYTNALFLSSSNESEVVNNTAIGNLYGYHIRGEGPKNIADNTALNTTYYAFYLKYLSHMHGRSNFTNNTINRAATGIYMEDSDGIDFVGNRISNISSPGTAVRMHYYNGGCQYNVFERNTISDSPAVTGFYMGLAATENNFTSNNFSNIGWAFAAQDTCGLDVFANNTVINGCGFSLIYSSFSNTITSNYVRNCRGNAAYSVQGNSNILLNNTAVDSEYSFRISYGAQDNSIINNTAINSTYLDLHIWPDATSPCQNTITGNTGSNGLPILFYNNSVPGGVLSDMEATELVLCNVSNAVVNNFTVSGSPIHSINGIYLLNCLNVTVSNSTSRWNSLAYNILYSFGSRLENNVIENFKTYGFYLVYSNNTLFTDNAVINTTSPASSNPSGFSILFATNTTFLKNSNMLNYNVSALYFCSYPSLNTSSYGNTGWWPLLFSDGSNSCSSTTLAWYNGTSGGRDYNGSYNPDLHYWYGNQ